MSPSVILGSRFSGNPMLKAREVEQVWWRSWQGLELPSVSASPAPGAGKFVRSRNRNEESGSSRVLTPA